MNKQLAAGLYVHIPFCRSKCPYCDFYSITTVSLLPQWISAIEREILLYKDRFSTFDSLYLGGGTPTVLSHGQWSHLMRYLFKHFTFSPRTEITVEANPDDVNGDLMHLLRSLGVNRISLGVQSFYDRELHDLQRRHTSGRAMEALRCIRRSGFTNIGIDLMYGLPGQTEDLWLATLKHALDFSPEHISCYQLTIEEKTPYGKMRDCGMIRPLEEEQERAFFILTSDFLKTEGYVHYEVSNYARGKEWACRHNMKYWLHAPYLGIGPSSHSYQGNRRWWNRGSVAGYCRALSRESTPVAGHETLSEEQLYLESLLLGLRTSEGIVTDRLPHRTQTEKLLRDLRNSGLVKLERGRIIPTSEGFLVADSLPLLFSL